MALAWAVAAGAAPPDPAAWAGDARFLVAAVDSTHPEPFRRHPRAEWAAAAESLERRLPGLDYAQAVGGLARLLALAADGHSRLDQVQLPSHARASLAPLPGPGFEAPYPFMCEVFTDGLYIVRVPAAQSRLMGARVLEVMGRPPAAVLEALRPYISADNEMWTLYMLPEYLRSPGYLHAAGLTPTPTSAVAMRLSLATGRPLDVTIAPQAADTSARWLEVGDAPGAPPLPLYRRLPGPFTFVDLGDSAKTVYARLREIVNPPGGERFAHFVERLFAHLDSTRAGRLVLDLRGNAGGDNYLNQPLVHGLIARPALDRPGRLFVVTDRGTFSAAVSLAADLERNTHALFVGEPTGSPANSCGDPRRVTLPRSGLTVKISTLAWQGSDPRDARPWIAPDLPAPLAFADWVARRDPALDAIRAFREADAGAPRPPNQNWVRPSQSDKDRPGIRW
jgi:hypothetical protein